MASESTRNYVPITPDLFPRTGRHFLQAESLESLITSLYMSTAGQAAHNWHLQDKYKGSLLKMPMSCSSRLAYVRASHQAPFHSCVQKAFAPEREGATK